MTKVKQIVDFLLERYPTTLASSFDQGKVGLQFGSLSSEVKKVMITLDSTTEVIDEALNNGCNMIISHHPFMFSPLLNLDYKSPLGKKLIKVFNNELNLFAMHTNFDVAKCGMNDYLAHLIGLRNVYSLPDEPTSESFFRIGEIEPTTLKEFALKVKDTFKEEAVRVVGDFDKKVKKVAVLGGSGGLFVLDAKRAGCDVIVTGEIRHNNAIDALDYNIGIVEVSHSVERYFKFYIINELEKTFPDVEFILATKDTNPFRCL